MQPIVLGHVLFVYSLTPCTSIQFSCIQYCMDTVFLQFPVFILGLPVNSLYIHNVLTESTHLMEFGYLHVIIIRIETWHCTSIHNKQKYRMSTITYNGILIYTHVYKLYYIIILCYSSYNKRFSNYFRRDCYNIIMNVCHIARDEGVGEMS